MRRAPQYMDEESLQVYSQESPDEVLAFASQNENAFLNTFKRRKYCSHPIRRKQLVKLLYLLVQSEDKSFMATKLAQIMSTDNEFAQFNMSIDQHLKKVPMESRGYIKRENLTFISQLVTIGREAIKVIPSVVVYTYPILSMQQTVRDLELDGERLGIIPRELEALAVTFDEEKRKLLAQKCVKKKKSATATGEPPEPFTELSILPTMKELLINSKKVFLRPNITSGGYENWEHYFDIQFRLLREDFIRPLREGVVAYSSPSLSSKQNITDIRIYEDARILNPVCLYSGMGFQVKFDVSKLTKVKWEHSRRLIFGSLLCLSDDNFHNQILFATVIKRDPKLLEDGIITIKFEGDSNPFEIDPRIQFKMVESTAYFEAYRYILKRLQDLSMYPEKMPMKNYIVDSVRQLESPTSVPGFLKLRGSPPIFDLQDIIKTRWPFDVTDLKKWPLASKTGLDPSQLEALKASLTQEVAVIQGPPGTGKTFIGLKIAEAYLRNRHVWDPQKSSPILVVCYTNHALDQFLQGIMEIKGGLAPNIIRIGGRSKNEALSECLLREKVQEARSDRSIPKSLFVPFQEARSVMNVCQQRIQREMQSSDAESKNEIVELPLLRPFIHEDHYDQLLYEKQTERNKEIEVWLELWYPEMYEELPQQQHFSSQPYEDLTTNSDDENSNEEDLIKVDNEAQILQDRRMIAGEDIELMGSDPQIHFQRKQIQVPKVKKSQYDWKVTQIPPKKKKKLILNGFQNKPLTGLEARRVRDIWKISNKQKWGLYLYWWNEYILKCKQNVNAEAAVFNQTCAEYNNAQKKIECHVAQHADVIGMTTTGAAKYHHLLDGLHPKIVIFEEAAEVLEAHLVTSITASVQQMILIGDHKQLRPKPTCYDLEKDYNLDISLFERLVEPKDEQKCAVAGNSFPHVTLEVQHRMRPEISKLVHPAIYNSLIDAEDVKTYENVKGISKNLFFISHTSPEKNTGFTDSRSHCNAFEAEYAIQLCRYLLLQGYSPSEITILTMYRGQLLELKNHMELKDKGHAVNEFEGIRVAAVDDFQGEENDIIILSLVRSNSDDSIGFLSIENRVCVSLSRAKKGLYIIGNGMLLKNHMKKDTKWPEIIRYLEKEQCIGRNLLVYCQNHPQDIKEIVKPEDFRTRPEGGCLKICNQRLPCGHSCPRMCHIRDSDHKNAICNKVCNKRLPCGHICSSKCYECQKSISCKPCNKSASKQLPCGHTVNVKCSTRMNQAYCTEPCQLILDCGHKCANRCSMPCVTRCQMPVTKTLPCGHQNEVKCFEDPAMILCSHPCETQLECEDICKGTCGLCKCGRLHVQCKKTCGRDLICGHQCGFPCASTCPPCNKPCNNYCIHSTCRKKCYESCDPCMEPCLWKCKHIKCSKPCGELCNRPPCNKPCEKILTCRHKCIGLCGECCPKKCRICHRDEVCNIFFGSEDEEGAMFMELQDCGHIFEVKGLDTWMEQEGSSAIMFKCCPQCKTPIRKSLRYGNQIKKVLMDVDAIKKKQQVNLSTLNSMLSKAEEAVGSSKYSKFISEDIAKIHREAKSSSPLPDSFHVSAMEFQLAVLPKLLQLKSVVDDYKGSSIEVSGFNLTAANNCLQELKSFIIHYKYLTSQQRSDILSEYRRVSCSIKLFDLFLKLRIQRLPVSKEHTDSISEFIRFCNDPRPGASKVTKDYEAKCMEFIKLLSDAYHINGLSEKERVEIVEAMGFAKGHWYKCPNGHFYCIGDCGGAVQTAKCPDCNATIGGERHALASGNAHAGEMDNSRFAIYSDAANLQNFDPVQLARLRL